MYVFELNELSIKTTTKQKQKSSVVLLGHALPVAVSTPADQRYCLELANSAEC